MSVINLEVIAQTKREKSSWKITHVAWDPSSRFHEQESRYSPEKEKVLSIEQAE